jgi:hypothetical protein
MWSMCDRDELLSVAHIQGDECQSLGGSTSGSRALYANPLWIMREDMGWLPVIRFWDSHEDVWSCYLVFKQGHLGRMVFQS